LLYRIEENTRVFRRGRMSIVVGRRLVLLATHILLFVVFVGVN
jgi:hypothetical protein